MTSEFWWENSLPGSGDSWRDYWEFYDLNDLFDFCDLLDLFKVAWGAPKPPRLALEKELFEGRLTLAGKAVYRFPSSLFC